MSRYWSVLASGVPNMSCSVHLYVRGAEQSPPSPVMVHSPFNARRVVGFTKI